MRAEMGTTHISVADLDRDAGGGIDGGAGRRGRPRRAHAAGTETAAACDQTDKCVRHDRTRDEACECVCVCIYREKLAEKSRSSNGGIAQAHGCDWQQEQE